MSAADFLPETCEAEPIDACTCEWHKTSRKERAGHMAEVEALRRALVEVREIVVSRRFTPSARLSAIQRAAGEALGLID